MDTYAVIGLGRFGTRLAQLLASNGAEVIAVDTNRALVEELRDEVDLAVCLDATDEEAIRSQGVDKVDVAVVGIGSQFESALLTTVLLKQLGVPRVISRATSHIRAQIFAKVGADDIVNPEREAAQRWCNRLVAPYVADRVELAEHFSLVQVPAPQAFQGKTLGDLDVRRNYHVQIVAIRRTTTDVDADGKTRSREVVISVPMAETEIKPGDVLLCIGSDDAMDQLADL
jgi:trk system potassium uptake protein